jgi:hypothetical protein
LPEHCFQTLVRDNVSHPYKATEKIIASCNMIIIFKVRWDNNSSELNNNNNNNNLKKLFFSHELTVKFF